MFLSFSMISVKISESYFLIVTKQGGFFAHLWKAKKIPTKESPGLEHKKPNLYYSSTGAASIVSAATGSSF